MHSTAKVRLWGASFSQNTRIMITGHGLRLWILNGCSHKWKHLHIETSQHSFCNSLHCWHVVANVSLSLWHTVHAMIWNCNWTKLRHPLYVTSRKAKREKNVKYYVAWWVMMKRDAEKNHESFLPIRANFLSLFVVTQSSNPRPEEWSPARHALFFWIPYFYFSTCLSIASIINMKNI